MASNCGRRFLQRSKSSARSFLNHTRTHQSTAAGPSKLGGLAPTTTTRLSRRRSYFFSSSRLPAELGCAGSLMPFHSATASALLKSMLASEVGQWGCLSEGFATPL